MQGQAVSRRKPQENLSVFQEFQHRKRLSLGKKTVFAFFQTSPKQMVDAFLAAGGIYFDTAYTYLDGMSEIALRESLVKRHPRSSFQIADKLPGGLQAV